ncbi:bifunctional riboflavin kinase/FAD synthetase [Paenibacillus allorhizosphaerae]|uniref:Riboflavin biosynthesis protein n=1 Tax=Paenibacillus allorhizosphaerae TaxID=2849866 RepID=A0ABM8VD02_9BACL|nr:bifunctional riboflavin kinase/FAD synthetase [Paenibacillus allorhizosphaerae]CAG7623942.1 Bifunctional riboflavin kinase/FMN adenylyltransferase [Paenibacillus allorhizosphaerae]
MQTVELQYPLQNVEPNAGPQVLAIGDFDGVHLGHQEVIHRAVQRGAELHVPAAIMTFHPHPRQMLGMDTYTKIITPLAAKQTLLRELRVNTTYIVNFSESFMHLTPEQFVENILIPLNVNSVFVGFDFRFGHKGAGTPDTLCELAKGRFAVEIVRQFSLQGRKVSSTLVREHLLRGEVREAMSLLGRPYLLRGTVVHGEARGRTIGFPTANIRVSEPYIIPANGVYAVEARVGDRLYGGVMNIGVKPTFESDLAEPTLEVHLFDFSQDIYGEEVAVSLIEFIREERKFTSVQELIAQIASDADKARSIVRERKSVQNS